MRGNLPRRGENPPQLEQCAAHFSEVFQHRVIATFHHDIVKRIDTVFEMLDQGQIRFGDAVHHTVQHLVKAKRHSRVQQRLKEEPSRCVW
jgi:hypothetical protein